MNLSACRSTRPAIISACLERRRQENGRRNFLLVTSPVRRGCRFGRLGHKKEFRAQGFGKKGPGFQCWILPSVDGEGEGECSCRFLEFRFTQRTLHSTDMEASLNDSGVRSLIEGLLVWTQP